MYLNDELAVKDLMRTKYLALELLLVKNEKEHRKVFHDLEKNEMRCKTNFPKDVLATFNYLTNYQEDRIIVEFRSEELHFTDMASKKITETDGNQPPRDFSNRTCYECGETEHIGKDYLKQDKHLMAKAKSDADIGRNTTTKRKRRGIEKCTS